MNKYLTGILSVALWLCAQNFVAAQTVTNDTTIDDLTNLVARINAKIAAGKTQEADFSDNLKEFDALVAKHKGAQPEELAQVLFMKAKLYNEVLEEPGPALELYKQIKRDYPTIQIGGNTDQAIKDLEAIVTRWNIWHTLTVGTKFPDFTATNLVGKPLSLGDYKGKVVLVDFWATWCLPCQAQLPYLLKTYSKYHGRGFEIVGVSLDDDQQKLLTFARHVGMTWPQTCDGQGMDGKLPGQYGIYQIPNTFLLNGQGIIIGKELRGDALELAVSNALPRE